jgi:crossover junction endodeoxyribonuclease RusA
MITFAIPLHLCSVANIREHWSDRARRTKSQRYGVAAAAVAFGLGPIIGEVTVKFTRIAPRMLDTDNLAAAFKAIRDGVADAMGLRDDNDERVTWQYAQEKGKHSIVRVEVSENEPLGE